jgi:hypothetical protein
MLIIAQRRKQQMTKTLVRFFGGAALVWGTCLLGLPASAQAQGSVKFVLSADTNAGPARQTYPEVIHVTNEGTEDATGVTVTFTPPKGVKVDSDCQIDHLPGGIRSYTCLVGTIGYGQTVDVSFSISMTKPGDASFTADVTCDQLVTDSTWLWLTIS